VEIAHLSRLEIIAMKRILPRFTLGSLFLLVLVVAMGIGWWLDRSKLERELINAQTRLAANELLSKEREAAALDRGGLRSATFGGGFTGVNQTPPISPYSTPAEFIEALRSMRDYYEWQDRAVKFAATEVADDALPLLIKLLEDPDPKVRERTLLTLAYLDRHAEALVPVIVPLLDDNDQNVRWHAANALGNFGSKARSALPSMLRIVENESSPISAFVVGIAFKIDPSVDVEPRLQVFLRSTDANTRWRATEALGRIAPHKAVSKATEEALLEAFRLSEDEPTKRGIAGLLDRISKGPTDATYDEEKRRESLSDAPPWQTVNGGVPQDTQHE
jgi:HEAT repeat protein